MEKGTRLTAASFLGDYGICDRKVIVTLKSTKETHEVLVTGTRYSEPIFVTCGPKDSIKGFSVDDIEHVVYNDEMPWG